MQQHGIPIRPNAELCALHGLTWFTEAQFKGAVLAFCCAGELSDGVPVPDLVPMLLHHTRVSPPCEACLPVGETPRSVIDHFGNTPLHVAAIRDHLSCAQTLIQMGADVNDYDECHLTPLMDAAAHGHTNILQLLLSAGAEVDRRDVDGWTALMHAVHVKQVRAAELLLCAGADTDVKDFDGSTAVSLAHGHRELVELLSGKTQ